MHAPSMLRLGDRGVRRTLVAAGTVAATVAVVAVTAPASVAATLAGAWAPFSYCPVDDPVMLNAPANSFGTDCVAASSASGTFEIGKTTIATGATGVQFGVSGAEADDPMLGNIVPASDGQTLESAPVDVPGGLLGLVGPLATLLHGLNGVTATVELAGTPTGFAVSLGSISAGDFGPGTVLFTLPVKVHLENRVLGKTCYIGSNTDPIVLKPAIASFGSNNATISVDDLVATVSIPGVTLRDDTFAVPGAHGCGLGGLLDSAINAKEHLPSPAGNNHLIMNDADANLALTQSGGQVLRDAWHANVTAP